MTDNLNTATAICPECGLPDEIERVTEGSDDTGDVVKYLTCCRCLTCWPADAAFHPGGVADVCDG